MNNENKDYVSKTFLNNSVDETGAMCSTIKYPDNCTYIEASVKISDCSKWIVLDFSFFSDDSRSIKERIEKINTMRWELEKFREQLKKYDV